MFIEEIDDIVRNFAEFEMANGELSLFMYSRKVFAQANGEIYVPPKSIFSMTNKFLIYAYCVILKHCIRKHYAIVKGLFDS